MALDQSALTEPPGATAACASSGKHLTVGQRAAVLATTTSGRGAELVVGVAGSGKTTALTALRDAFEAEGYRVLGTPPP